MLCDREKVSQDPEVSPAPVGPDENLCRGAFAPAHVTQHKDIRPKVIALSHLRKCILSVWREGGQYGEKITVVRELLWDAATRFKENELHTILRANAKEIRSLRFENAGASTRCFLIVDECDCDQYGNKHPAHAHIGFCCDLLELDTGEADDIAATWAQQALLFQMKSAKLPASA